MKLKQYQLRTLEAVRAYFRECQFKAPEKYIYAAIYGKAADGKSVSDQIAAAFSIS